MAKQTGKSGLMAKYGQKLAKAVATHAADETSYGIQNVPPGIRNGIAKLIECKFDQYKSGVNKGEYYFLAAGIVVSPDSVATKDGEVPVKGLRTQIMEAVCDTTNKAGKTTTQDEHVANILNEMRKLGADTEGASGEDLESLAASLKEAGPYFKFSTSASDPTPEFPNPKIWENWHGGKGLEDYVPEAGDDAVSDGTAEEETEEAAEGEEGGEEEAEKLGDAELAKLAKIADRKPVTAAVKDAQAKIDGNARLVGVKSQDYGTWSEVVDAINEADAAAEGGDEEYGTAEQETEITPAKGEIYMWKGPKMKKAAEHEVMLVNSKAKQVTLKNLDDQSLHKGVSWSELSAE